MMRRREALPGLAALLAAPAWGQAAPDPRIAAVEQGLLPPVVSEVTTPMSLASRMRHHGVPGVSVAVVDRGRLAWAHAWGLAQAGEPVPLTPDTLMQAGSVSKAVTALAVLRLADQGRLDLDADIAPLLRGWRLPTGAQSTKRPVTVRGLLSHTAGLTVHGFAGYVPGQPLPTLAQVLDGVPPANSPPVRVATEPGREWRYSGGGYVLLQLLLEDLTGEPFAAWMQRQLLQPAGMAASRFGRLPDAPLGVAAAGHMEGRVIDGRRANMVEEAAGGLWSTPTDLARLALGLQAAMAGRAQPWLTPARLAEARRRPDVPRARTGLGLFLHGPHAFGHDGRNAGFDSRWLVDGQRALVVMINGNADELIEEIARAVAVAHGWDDLAPPRVTRAQAEAGFAAGPVYLRGSFNAWGTGNPLQAGAGRRYVLEIDLPAGRLEYKFGSADWQAVDLGAGEGAELRREGANLAIEVPRAGRYRFSLDASDALRPRHTVERLSP